MNKVDFSPYVYMWGFGNSEAYLFTDLQDMRSQIDIKSVCLAFVISNSLGNDMREDVYMAKDTIKKFTDDGYKAVLSFGGASAPYMSDLVPIKDAVGIVSRFMKDTGIRSLDFDIEGAYVGSPATVSWHIDLTKALRKEYPDLEISITLACMPAFEPNNGGGLDRFGVALVQKFYDSGVFPFMVSPMLMEYNRNTPPGMTFGEVHIETMKFIRNQVKEITGEDDWKYFGMIPMLGNQIGIGVTTVQDYNRCAEFAKSVGLGRLSNWALNRDQVGNSNLAIHSKVNKTNYEFHNNALSILGDSVYDPTGGRSETPVTPTVPVTPTKPVSPTTPVTPTVPVTPTTPVTPTVPVTPTTPVTPTVPVTPTTPVTNNCCDNPLPDYFPRL